MNDRLLGQLLQVRQARDSEPGRHCLNEDTIAAFAEGHLNATARMEVEEHLAGCGFCREQVGYLVRVLAEAEETETIPAALLERAKSLVRQPSPTTIWRYQWVGAAAVVLLTVGVAWQAWIPLEPSSVPPKPQVESAPAPPAMPSAPAPVPPVSAPSSGRAVRNRPMGAATPELVFPQEDAELQEAELLFRWQDVPARVFYQVQIVSHEGVLVWRTRTESNEIALPSVVTLQPGAFYFVWVRAELQDGRTVKSSAVRFRVVGP